LPFGKVVALSPAVYFNTATLNTFIGWGISAEMFFVKAETIDFSVATCKILFSAVFPRRIFISDFEAVYFKKGLISAKMIFYFSGSGLSSLWRQIIYFVFINLLLYPLLVE